MLVVIFSLSCAVAYGVADFWGGLATRRAHLMRVMPTILLAGVMMLIALIPFVGFKYSQEALIAGMVAGIAGSVGYGLVLQSLALGPMGVVAPITAVTAAIFPFGVGYFRGEQLSAQGWIGAFFALISVVLVSRSTEDASHPVTRKAVLTAFFGGISVAIYLLGLAGAPDDSGVASVLIARICTFALVGAIALAMWKKFGNERPNYRLAIASGALDVCGGTSFMLATRHGALVIVAVISALYPALTVLLARIILHERLERHQVIGLIGAGLSVTLLAIA